jgi:hypothetical protein
MMTLTRFRVINHYQEYNKKLTEPDPRGELPLSRILSKEIIEESLTQLNIKFRNRIFNPYITLWLFVSQILSSPQSCQSAVLRLVAWLSRNDKRLCSTRTGGYVQARQRLSVSLIRGLAKKISARIRKETANQTKWTFHGRSVKLVDGTTLSIEDTKKNNRKYPKRKNIFGYPLIRLVSVICHSTGTVMDLKIAPYIGKGTGELSLFIKLIQHSDALKAGNILLADALFGTYLVISSCLNLGMDILVPYSDGSKKAKLKTIKFIKTKNGWNLENPIFLNPAQKKSSTIKRLRSCIFEKLSS